MKRVAILILSLVVSVAAAEVALRLFDPAPVRTTRRWLDSIMVGLSTAPGGRAYEPDPELGFRPIAGGKIFDEHGARYHQYPIEKRPGVRRVLFVGDSVTFRGQIVRGLRGLFGEQGYEYWNAGVESYGTMEEAIYLRDSIADLDADHIVLTFHPNDSYSTPACFPVDEDTAAIHIPGRGSWRVDIPWARRSALYAFFQGVRLVNLDFRRLESGPRRCEEGLRIIQAEAERRGARLSVLRFPFADPPANWDATERAAFDLGGELCERLGLECHDLLPYFERALDEGLEDYQQTPGDTWHPSEELGRRFAAGLVEDGFTL